jgi:carboxyl-terminal processing protease
MRRLMAALALSCAACGSWIVGTDAPASPAAIFDLVWTEFDRHYAQFELRGVDWNDVRERYRPRAASTTTQNDLEIVFAEMFEELRDVHVTLYTGTAERGYTGFESRPYFFEPPLIFGTYVHASRVPAGNRIRYGRVGSSTLGYIWIPGFGGTGWDNDIDTALDSLGDVSGIILDIRNNGGGNNQTSNRIAGRFHDEKRLSLYTRFRNGPAHDDFTDFLARHVEPVGARRFSGPVVLLTSTRNFSAAEDFVLAMKASPNVTLVGDTTGGSGGHPMYRELPNGWSYRLSESIMYTPEREPVDGTGIAPHVFIRQPIAINTRDFVLERGCEELGLPACGRAVGSAIGSASTRP